jgi:hypothetical protein
MPVTLPETIVRRRCAALIPYARNARSTATSKSQLDPGAVIRPVRGERTRACPSALTRGACGLARRPAMRVYRLVALTIGAGGAVADG